MFSSQKNRFLSPFFPLISSKKIENLLYFSIHLKSIKQFSSSADSFSLNLLLNNLTLGTGNLEEMEINLNKMKIRVTPELATQVIHSFKTLAGSNRNTIDKSSSRRLLRFFIWFLRSRNEVFDDFVFNFAIQTFAEIKDLIAMGIVISEHQKMGCRMDAKTFVMVIETLVKIGKADEAVLFFRNMVEKQMQFEIGEFSCITAIIHALCSKGHARKAEGVFWHHRNKLKEENIGIIYKILIHGWCVHGNVKEAKRILKEMKLIGITPGMSSYNDVLRCICNRNLRFNPSGIVSEATDLMMEMRSSGISPTTVSFNILLSCLSRGRRVKEACDVFSSMMLSEANCYPDQVTYYLVLRVLYLTKRFGKANGILDQLIKNGVVVETRLFHCLICVICGIDNVNCALEMFEKMKSICRENLGPTYDVLIEKLCRNGKFDVGRCLYDEAIGKGVVLKISSDLLDPLKVEVFKFRSPTTSSREKLVLGKHKGKVLLRRRKCAKNKK